MERTQIYLPKSQVKKLKSLAQKKKTTLSDMVREAVDVQYGIAPRVPGTKKPKREESLSEFAARIRKMGFKGPKDLASKLDQYLYGGKK